jgi:hypothetical protein
MSQQYHLFDPKQPTWIDRLWQEMDPRERQRMISILVAMAHASLKKKPLGKLKESADEA